MIQCYLIQVIVNLNSSGTVINGKGYLDYWLYSGNDQFDSGSLPSRIDGGDGNDTIIAGSGADILIGGPGIDTLTGNAGADTFVLSDGDTLTDVTPKIRC